MTPTRTCSASPPFPRPPQCSLPGRLGPPVYSASVSFSQLSFPPTTTTTPIIVQPPTLSSVRLITQHFCPSVLPPTMLKDPRKLPSTTVAWPHNQRLPIVQFPRLPKSNQCKQVPVWWFRSPQPGTTTLTSYHHLQCKYLSRTLLVNHQRLF